MHRDNAGRESHQGNVKTVRGWGWLAFTGILAFLLSLVALHFTGRPIDMQERYLSELANRQAGWIFDAGTLIHGLGNLALAMGLRASLPKSRLRGWSVSLFGLAAIGIVVAGIFSIDSPGMALTVSGAIHRAATSGAFAAELAALFIFSQAFAHCPSWKEFKGISLWLSGCAAVALLVFVISIELDFMPGLTERVALIVFLCWEIWVVLRLIRFR
jgi:hypothetical protein